MKTKITYLLIPLIIIIYISLNIFFTVADIQICPSNGCAIAKTIINVSYIQLNILGALFASLLFILGFLYVKKQNQKAKTFFELFLLLGVVCETILFSYLYLSTSEICLFCLGFLSFLLLNFLLLPKENLKFLLLPLGVILSLSLIDMKSGKANSFVDKDGLYLIQSDSCKYCKKVKAFMGENSISFIKQDVKESMAFLQSLNIDTIPVLVEKNDYEFKVIKGQAKIIDYLKEKNKIESSPEELLKSVGLGGAESSNAFSFPMPKEEGDCKIDKNNPDSFQECEK